MSCRHFRSCSVGRRGVVVADSAEERGERGTCEEDKRKKSEFGRPTEFSPQTSKDLQPGSKPYARDYPC
jgi:hypothetical protein